MLPRGKNVLLPIRHLPCYTYCQVMWVTTLHNKTKDINKKRTLLQTATGTDEPNIAFFRKTYRTLQHILIRYQGIKILLPQGRYLCRWIFSSHGVICQLVNAASAPTSCIRSSYIWNLQFLNNVIIINSKVNLPQLFVFCLDPLLSCSRAH